MALFPGIDGNVGGNNLKIFEDGFGLLAPELLQSLAVVVQQLLMNLNGKIFNIMKTFTEVQLSAYSLKDSTNVFVVALPVFPAR